MKKTFVRKLFFVGILQFQAMVVSAQRVSTDSPSSISQLKLNGKIKSIEISSHHLLSDSLKLGFTINTERILTNIPRLYTSNYFSDDVNFFKTEYDKEGRCINKIFRRERDASYLNNEYIYNSDSKLYEQISGEQESLEDIVIPYLRNYFKYNNQGELSILTEVYRNSEDQMETKTQRNYFYQYIYAKGPKIKAVKPEYDANGKKDVYSILYMDDTNRLKAKRLIYVESNKCWDFQYNDQGDVISEKIYRIEIKGLKILHSTQTEYQYKSGQIIGKESTYKTYFDNFGRLPEPKFETYIERFTYDNRGNLTELVSSFLDLDEGSKKTEDKSEKHILNYNEYGYEISDDCTLKSRDFIQLSWNIQYEYDPQKNCIRKTYTEKRGYSPSIVIETKYIYYE